MTGVPNKRRFCGRWGGLMPLDPLTRLEILINCLRPVLHLGRITLFCLFGHIIIAVWRRSRMRIAHSCIGSIRRYLAALNADPSHLIVRDHVDVSHAMPLRIVVDDRPVGFILSMFVVGQKYCAVLSLSARRINHLWLPTRRPGFFANRLK